MHLICLINTDDFRDGTRPVAVRPSVIVTHAWSERHNIQWNSAYRLMAITSFAGSSATQHCPFWFISIRRWSSLTLIWIKTPEKTCQGKPISGWTFNSVWHWCAETHINASTDQIKQCSVRHCWRFSKGQCIFLSILSIFISTARSAAHVLKKSTPGAYRSKDSNFLSTLWGDLFTTHGLRCP